jgi:hypothetical protein
MEQPQVQSSDEALRNDYYTKYSNQEIMQKIFSGKIEEVTKLFESSKDIKEIDAFKNALIKTTQKDELSDDDLAEVAGGFVLTTGMIATTAAVIGGTSTSAGFIHTITRSRW